MAGRLSFAGMFPHQDTLHGEPYESASPMSALWLRALLLRETGLDGLGICYRVHLCTALKEHQQFFREKPPT